MLNFAKCLRKLRKERNLTQKELANIINCSRTTITYYENGKRSPDSVTLCLLADYFNVSLDYFLGRSYNSFMPVFYSGQTTEDRSIMLVFDPVNGQIVDCSTRAEKLHKYNKAKLKNMTIYDLNIEDEKEVRKKIEKAINHNQNIFLVKHRLADGVIKKLLTNLEPLVINEKTYLVSNYSIPMDNTDDERHDYIFSSVFKYLGKIIEIKCPYKADHAENVSQIASTIGEELALSERQMLNLKTAAILHDIGEIYIPYEILNKAKKYNKDDLAFLKKHPEDSYKAISSFNLNLPVAEIALQHHERLDGSGYPYQLKGKDIILEAKILAVADILAAMTAKRPHRDTYSIKYVINHLNKNTGSKYEKRIVEACNNLHKEGKL